MPTKTVPMSLVLCDAHMSIQVLKDLVTEIVSFDDRTHFSTAAFKKNNGADFK